MFILRYFLLFGMLTFTMNAQNTSPENELVLSLAPLSLLDIFDGASIRVGAEKRIKSRTAIGLDGGTYLNYLKATKINPSGYLLRPSVKYYLNPEKPGRFVALEYQFKHQKYNFIDSIVIDADRFEKEYAMKRAIHSVTFKYGNLSSLGKKFTLEWFFGIGIRHIRSSSNLTPEEEDGRLTGEAGDCPIQEDLIRLTGTRIFPDFRAGIKIGYRLHL